MVCFYCGLVGHRDGGCPYKLPSEKTVQTPEGREGESEKMDVDTHMYSATREK